VFFHRSADPEPIQPAAGKDANLRCMEFRGKGSLTEGAVVTSGFGSVSSASAAVLDACNGRAVKAARTMILRP